MRSTKASCVIPKLDRIFAVHGIPIVLETANVPPFNGEEQKRYGEALGNAKEERFMQPLAKVLKTAKITQRP